MNPKHTIRSDAFARARVAALLVALLAVPGTAANAAGSTSAFADTTRPVTFLREVVVTGSRFPRAYYQSPQALSFLGRAQLRETVPAVIGDVLSRLPGVDMSKDSPWEQRPVLRGLSGQRVLVMMDGMPMNSARGNGPHPSLVDPSQIERVEVVRGPSSVAYGSDALGGAINIITREAPAADGTAGMNGSAAISGGTGENQGGGSIELMPHAGRFSSYLSGGLRSAKNFRAPQGEIPHSSFRDYDGLFNARFDVNPDITLKGGYQLYRGSDIGIPGLSSPTYDYGFGGAYTTVFQFKNYDRDLAHVTLDHRFGDSWLAATRWRLYWQAERRDFWSDEKIDASAYSAFGINFDPNSAGSTFRRTYQDRYFDLKTWGLQFQATSVQTRDYRFTMGVDAARDVTAGTTVRTRYYQKAAGILAAPTKISKSVPYGNFDNVGAFFQNEWYVAPRVTVNSGARWTSYRDRTEPWSRRTGDLAIARSVNNDALCGSVGVVYTPMPDLHLSANVANGYRQPNAQDLFFNGPASVGTVLGNDSLKAEKSVSYDVGMRYENSREALSANVFWSTYDDLIDALPYSPGTFRYVNISKARIFGIEGEGEWVVARQYKVRATAAGAIGDITSNDAIVRLYYDPAHPDPNIKALGKAPLGGVPPFKGSLALRWTESDGRGWIEPAVNYSWRTNRLPLPTPGVGQLTDFKKEWIAADLMAGWKFPGGQRLVGGVRNVADRRYRQALASLPSPGRSFVASLSTPF